MSNSPKRHPKCSTLYASRLRRDSNIKQPMASSVAYLINVTVVITAKTMTRGAYTFALTVHDTKSSSTWRHLRSYSECRKFQNRVSKLLSRGHLCFAECPWLYAYLLESLPGDREGYNLFRIGSRGRVIEKQRQALERLFLTMQRVLLNPLNQKCTVLMKQVAPEVIRFITNRNDLNEHVPLISPCELPLAKTFSEALMVEANEIKETDDKARHNSTATAATSDDQEEAFSLAKNTTSAGEKNEVATQHVCCAMCALHKMRSDEQVFASWQAETTSNRFMRLGSKTVTSIVAMHEIKMAKEKDAWESPACSQRMSSPLELSEAQGGRNLDYKVSNHDGTPKEPFPGSPYTPRASIESSSRASSVCGIDLQVLDGLRLSGTLPLPTKDSHTATSVKTPQGSRVENLRGVSRRSLLMLTSIRSKFTLTKQGTGVI